MWLRNDALAVFFDERRGGMPVGDSFGFIRAAAIEIAYAQPPPFFQSLNDRRPHIEKHGNSVVASGIMRRGREVTPHTYEMKATLEGNRLDLAYRLNVARTEEVMRSKIWVWAARRGKIPKGNWADIYLGRQPKPFTLFGGRLKISGSTTPPVYARVCHLREYPKYEVAYGWARGLLQKGTYSGNITLDYEKA